MVASLTRSIGPVVEAVVSSGNLPISPGPAYAGGLHHPGLASRVAVYLCFCVFV